MLYLDNLPQMTQLVDQSSYIVTRGNYDWLTIVSGSTLCCFSVA
jgi:hypothetical protein